MKISILLGVLFYLWKIICSFCEEDIEMVREVSESCVESLLTEIVSSYCNGFYADKPELAARRIEAIGFQVGHQLSER